MHVAFVGREDIERERTEQRIAGFFEDDRLAAMIEADAAHLGRHVGCEEPGRAAFRDKLTPQRLVGSMRRAPRIAFERNDLVAYEITRALL